MHGVYALTSMFSQCTALGDIRIDSWDVTSVTLASNFMLNHPGLTSALYDSTLVNWEAQVLQPNVVIKFSGSVPASAEGIAAKVDLENAPNTWTILDGT
jgi:hypothetical protein